MPDYLKRVGRDVTDDILVRVPESEKLLSRVHGPASKRPSIDRGDIPAVAAPLEGQMMIQYADNAPYNGEQPYYYSNGQWRPFTSSVALNPATEYLEVSSVSIGGSSSTALTWAHISGTSLLDLSGPTAPKVLTAGVYTVDATAVVTSGASAHNHFQLIAQLLAAAFTAAVHAQDAYSDVAGDAIEAAISLTGVMAANDTFSLQIFNFDSGSRNFNCPSIRVTRIYEI